MAEAQRAALFQFGLEERMARRPARALARPLGRLLDRALGVTELERLYSSLPRNATFWGAALQALNVEYAVIGGTVARIPRSGPLVVVANHPFGGVDGLILMSLLVQARVDVRILGNYLLGCVPELREVLIPVDPFRARASRAINAAAARSAARWLEGGGAIAVFPAGDVSRARRLGIAPVDSEWSEGAARLGQRAGAGLLPVFFHGHNSRLFDFVGRLCPPIGTALLPRELLNKRGCRISVSIGTCISAGRLAGFDTPADLMSYVRARTYALAGPDRPSAAPPATFPERRVVPIAEAARADALEREVTALDPSQVLVRGGGFRVCLARASEIPRVLLEIGRLREIAFRTVGEGSGQRRDVDRFDGHYLHLFVWNADRRDIAGAYRIGATDEILPGFGISGLYTSTLFRFDERLLAQIGPALELGRAFVALPYQRDYSPLLLLWKGIATFVFSNPRYRMLFGPVSISNSYQSVSRQILARFLHATSYRPELGELVAPRNPPAFLRHGGSAPALGGPAVRTLADVATLLAEIEVDQKGVPVLVKQYLKLSARLLGFNVDREFGDALDGLMLVDLVDVHPAILARYMGAERAAQFLAYHGAPPRPHGRISAYSRRRARAEQSPAEYSCHSWHEPQGAHERSCGAVDHQPHQEPPRNRDAIARCRGTEPRGR